MCRFHIRITPKHDGWVSLIETLYNAVLCAGTGPVSGSPVTNTK